MDTLVLAPHGAEVRSDLKSGHAQCSEYIFLNYPSTCETLFTFYPSCFQALSASPPSRAIGQPLRGITSKRKEDIIEPP